MNILDFVMVGSDDHEKSGDFYDAVFEPLKLERVLKTQKYLGYAHSSDPEKVQFYVTPVSYTHLRAHETRGNLVCRLLLEKKK